MNSPAGRPCFTQVVASLVPFAKGVPASAAQAGPFNPAAEAANGRLAMLAVTCVAVVEAYTGGVFLDVLKERAASLF